MKKKQQQQNDIAFCYFIKIGRKQRERERKELTKKNTVIPIHYL